MNYPLLYQWEEQLRSELPSLNSWQAANMALFSYGIIQAESSQQGAVARQVVCGEKVESASRRWRRFLSNAAFSLGDFFREWSSWVLRGLGMKAVSLLVDETKLGDRLGVMMVGVAWEGRCLPLAWWVYVANSAADYPAVGQVGMIKVLLEQIRPGVPDGVEVLVQADRGIGTSPDLCRAVEQLGWHYLFRVTCQTKLVLPDGGDVTIAQQVQPGEIWTGQGLVFKQRGRIPAYACAVWTAGYDQPWALVTNDERLTGHEYARRNWQEQGFRDLKSGGWHWHDSRIREPHHMARLLVLLALAYVWMVALGSVAVASGCAQSLLKRADGTQRRHWSLFKEGLRFFVQHVQRLTASSDLRFIPDHRFT